MTFLYLAESINLNNSWRQMCQMCTWKNMKNPFQNAYQKSNLVGKVSKPSLVFQEVIPSREQLVARSFKRIFWPEAYLLSIWLSYVVKTNMGDHYITLATAQIEEWKILNFKPLQRLRISMCFICLNLNVICKDHVCSMLKNQHTNSKDFFTRIFWNDDNQ